MKKRHSAEQIVGLLRQADVALGKGERVPGPNINWTLQSRDIRIRKDGWPSRSSTQS